MIGNNTRMKISRATYEVVFVDFLEGNLSDKEIQDLVDFLDQNPDLEEELKELSMYSKHSNTSENIHPSHFNSNNLKKEVVLDGSISNFEELCISFYEGLLSESEEQKLLELVESDSNLYDSFELYSHVKFEPDQAVIYPNKKDLKRSKKVSLVNYISYAASIVIVFGLVFYIQNIKDNPTQNIGTNEYASSSYSFMDYPKVGFFKEETISNTILTSSNDIKSNIEKSKPDIKKVKKNNTVVQIPAQEDFFIDKIEHEDNADDFYYSRKGKLAYSSPTELESYLSKIFANQKNNETFSNFGKSNINSHSVKEGNTFKSINPSQLAISLDPTQYQKRILGSQPIE